MYDLCVLTFSLYQYTLQRWYYEKKNLYSQEYELRSFMENIPLMIEIKFWKWSFH